MAVREVRPGAAAARAGTSKKPSRSHRREFPDAVAVGTQVVYKGGSRAAWLKTHAKGTVTAHFGNPSAPRYGVCFGEKTTVLAGKYLERVKK